MSDQDPTIKTSEAPEATDTPDTPDTEEASEQAAGDGNEAEATAESESVEAAEEAAAPSAPAETDLGSDQIGEDEPLITEGMNWFVLRVASNKEDSVKETLLRKVSIEGLTDRVNRILVPTEKQKTVKAGKTKIVEKKLYPGYVFVEMRLEPDGRIPQDVFFLIKETTGVGDFIGTAGRPSPMSIPEIEKMIQHSKPAEEAPEVKVEFEKGDIVKIVDGPFENTDGEVDEIMADQGKVRVVATVFGRPTPIELEIWQIERADEEE